MCQKSPSVEVVQGPRQIHSFSCILRLDHTPPMFGIGLSFHVLFISPMFGIEYNIHIFY